MKNKTRGLGAERPVSAWVGGRITFRLNAGAGGAAGLRGRVSSDAPPAGKHNRHLEGSESSLLKASPSEKLLKTQGKLKQDESVCSEQVWRLILDPTSAATAGFLTLHVREGDGLAGVALARTPAPPSACRAAQIDRAVFAKYC